MLELFLVPLMAALLFGVSFSNGSGSDDDDGGGGGGTDPVPTDGNDTLTVDPETRGTFDALAGDDTISVSAATGGTFEDVTPLQFAWNTESTDAPLQVLGGAGDDSITVTGNGVEVNGGEGADLIRVDGLRNAVIFGGDMDTIQGQDAESPPLSADDLDVIYTLTGSATFSGGSSDEVVTTTGAGAVVDAGGGDDVVRDFGGSVTLSGGDGDDTLQADISESAFLPSATDSLGFYLGNDADVLFGGAGDDLLLASHGDTLTGGAGVDRFGIYTDNTGAPGATIADFDPGSESAFVVFDSFGSPGGSGTETPASLPGRITTDLGPDGSQRVLGDGEVLVTLTGVTNARIGLDISAEGDAYTTLDGTPATAADFDVIVRMYPNVSS